MENRRTIDLITPVIIFFVLLFVYTKFIGPIPFSVNNINTNAQEPFQVQGTGKAAGAPDKAVIVLGVTASGTTVLDAQGKTNQAADRIINSLKGLGIDEKDIKTTNYSINPNYDFGGAFQRITGYSVTQNFEVKAPIDKANEVVDAATANGANLVGNISFTLDDDKLNKLTNEARKEAVEKAKASAQGLAEASGIRLGKIINVRETSGGGVPIPFTREAVGATDLVQEKTNITPGETNVEVTITLTYQTY